MIQHDDRGVRRKLIEIDKHGKGLTLWEIDFVADLLEGDAEKFSPIEVRKINQIHDDRVDVEILQ